MVLIWLRCGICKICRYQGWYRGIFAGLFDKVENVHWDTLSCGIVGDKAYCEYRRTAKHKDGTSEQYLSVDILTFKNGMITHKDTYYKQRN